MMLTAYRLELFKLVRRPASWVTYLCFLALTIVVLTAQRNGPQAHGHGFPDALPAVLTGDASLTSTFAIALIVLMICAEFDWRTSRQNIIDGLSKRQWFVGKVLLIPTVAIGLYLTRLAIGGIVALAAPGSHSHIFDPTATYVLAACGVVLGMLCYASVALLICITVRSTGPALAIALIYQVFDNIAAAILRSRRLEHIAQWLPLQIQSSLAVYNRYLPHASSPHNLPLVFDPETPLLFLAAAAWAAVLLFVSYRVYMKRDL
jgi:ABC-2 type transport system permease protein